MEYDASKKAEKSVIFSVNIDKDKPKGNKSIPIKKIPLWNWVIYSELFIYQNHSNLWKSNEFEKYFALQKTTLNMLFLLHTASILQRVK